MVACIFVTRAGDVAAQISTLPEAANNAEIRAQTLRSNVEAKTKADTEYLRLHPAEATNALTQHQLELLDIACNPANRSKYFSKSHSAVELQEFTNTLHLMLTNAAAQSSYFFHLHGGMTESEYASNLVYAISHTPPSKQWPEPSKKQEIFQHCAEVLRSAIDTNQIEMECNTLTNQPDTALALRDILDTARSGLMEFASLLINPDLNSYIGTGFRAELSNPTNIFYFSFWPSSLVRSLEKRTLDGRDVLAIARFYENGKLTSFESYTPRLIQVSCKQNGQLNEVWGVLNDQLQIHFYSEESGNLHVTRVPLKRRILPDSRGRFRNNEILSLKENGELDSFWKKT